MTQSAALNAFNHRPTPRRAGHARLPPVRAAVHSPKRVVFFAPGWPPHTVSNGVATYIAHMRTGLAPLGFDSSVAVGSYEGAPDPEVLVFGRDVPFAVRAANALLYRVNPGASFTFNMFSSLKLYARKQPFDLIEMEEAFGFSRHLAPLLDVPVIVRLHGPWFLNGEALGLPEDEAFRRKVAAEKKAIEKAKAISAPSQDVLDRTRAYYGLSLPHAVVIPNPGPEVSETARWRADACEPDTLLYVGRFDRHKGGDIAIEAFKLLAASRPTLRLLFVGPDRGLERDDGSRINLADYLSERVPDRAVRERIEVLGAQPLDALAALRRRAVLTIAASRYENAPLAVVEALAFASPLVASNAGGIPELVRHGETGMLFQKGDPQDLAAKVEAMLSLPDRGASLAAAGRRDYEARLTAHAISQRTADYYGQVLERA